MTRTYTDAETGKRYRYDYRYFDRLPDTGDYAIHHGYVVKVAWRSGDETYITRLHSNATPHAVPTSELRVIDPRGPFRIDVDAE